MKIKNVIVFFAVLAGLFGLMWWGKPAVISTVPTPGSNVTTGNNLTAEEKLYDFGTISMAKGNVDHRFKITNPTNEDVEIKDIATSCMCTIAYLESATGEKGPFGMSGHSGPTARVSEIIKAGESREIRVVYDPNAHGPAGVGPINRLVYLTDSSRKTLELEIKALVTP